MTGKNCLFFYSVVLLVYPISLWSHELCWGHCSTIMMLLFYSCLCNLLFLFLAVLLTQFLFHSISQTWFSVSFLLYGMWLTQCAVLLTKYNNSLILKCIIIMLWAYHRLQLHNVGELHFKVWTTGIGMIMATRPFFAISAYLTIFFWLEKQNLYSVQMN